MPFVTYSLLRIGLVLAATGVLWLVGVRHWLPLVGFGVLIGAGVAYLALPKQRDAAVAYLQERSERRKIAGEDEEVEDSLVEDSVVEGTAREDEAVERDET